MSCDEARRWLDDLVDGELGEALELELRAHLQACPECRCEAHRRRELLGAVASLPREIQPSRDLWPGIASRLCAQPAGPTRERRPRWQVWSGLVAAGVLLVTGTVLVTTRLMDLRAQNTAVHPGTPAGIAPAVITTGLEVPNAELERAASSLRTALESRRSQLSPATLKVVDENLAIIDAALGRLQTAVREDPGNRALVTLLTATWARKIDLLQTATELARTS